MAALNSPSQLKHHKGTQRTKFKSAVSSSMQTSQTNIKVVINGAAKEIGKAAVIAVTKARGTEVAVAVDSHLVGEDIGQCLGLKSVVYVPRISLDTETALSAFCEKASMVSLRYYKPQFLLPSTTTM